MQCSVDYKTNDWGSGFTADLTLTNRGTEAIDGWTLTYDYAGNQKLGNGWNGTWSQSGKTVTVKNASYNANDRRRGRRHHRRAVHATAAPTPRRPTSPSTAPRAPAPTSRRSPC